MKKFVARFNELDYLNQHFYSEDNQLIIVYGSKGVGKTRLLKQFGKDKNTCYYLAKSCSEREQRYQWSNELERQGINIGEYPAFYDLLMESAKSKGHEKILFVIDEFQHLLKSESTFFEDLIRFIHQNTNDISVMVVLCSSSPNFVENHLVEKIGNHARFINGFLKVKEFGLYDMRLLYPEYSFDDALRIYSVLGGNPGYWNCFDTNLNASENVIVNLLDKDSRLYNELNYYVEQELRESAVYNTILSTLARDCNKLNDIYRHTDFSRAKISVYLKNLMEIDLVEKVYSYDTEGKNNSQKGIYRIANPFIRFYFRYIFPNIGMLEIMDEESFFKKMIEPSFHLFIEETYRKVCRDSLKNEYMITGEWLGKTGNLDIVCEDREGNIVIGGCSYSRQMDESDYEWILFSMKKAKINTDRILLYSEKGFSGELYRRAADNEITLIHLKNESDN